MTKGCEWPGGCEADGVPEGVPVFNLTKLDSDEIDGVYCRVHAQKRASQMGRERRLRLGLIPPANPDPSSPVI